MSQFSCKNSGTELESNQLTLKRSFREKKRGEFCISIRHKHLTANHWRNKLSAKRMSEFPPPSSFPFSLDWFYAAAISRENAGLASSFNKNVLWIKHELRVGNCRITIRMHALIFFHLKCEWDQLVVYVIKILTFCEYKDTFFFVCVQNMNRGASVCGGE